MSAINQLRITGLAAVLSIAAGIGLLTSAWHGGQGAHGTRVLAVGCVIAGFILALVWLALLGRHDRDRDQGPH
jgi:hypothetical protein